MSTPTVRCPVCFTSQPAPPTGGDVRCGSCEHTFPAAAARPIASRPTTPRRDRDDDRPRRYRDDDDDRDRRPARTGGSALPLVLLGVGAVVLVLGGIVAVGVVVFANRPVAKNTAARSPAFAEPPAAWADEPEPVVDREVPVGPGPRGPDWEPKRPDEPIRPREVAPPPPPPPPPKPKPVQLAAVVPVEIKPAKLTADTVEVKLPGKVADTCAGGGGRYLFLHIPETKQLAVFDATAAKVVKYLPLAADRVKFAAGMNKLVVGYPAENTLVRYDLATLEKEATLANRHCDDIRHLCMGSASAGPLLVAGMTGLNGGRGAQFTRVVLLDPATFADADPERLFPQGSLDVESARHFRASPDSSVFGSWRTSSSPQGLESLVLLGRSATLERAHESPGHVVPGEDNHLYTANGIYTSQVKWLGQKGVLLPAAEGRLYLSVVGKDAAHFAGGMPDDGKGVRLEVRLPDEPKVLHTFKGIDLIGNEAWTKDDFTNDKRVHFVPSAHLLAVVPPTNDKLVLHRFDPDAAFEASGVDYLYVTSRPPVAAAGRGFAYQLAVKSRKGGVKFTLNAGPKGMTLSPAGQLAWEVPHEATTAEAVVVTITDAGGKEVLHSFTPVVRSPDGGAPTGAFEPAGKDGEAIVGTWRVRKLVMGGREVPDRDDRPDTLHYTFNADGTASAEVFSSKSTGTFKLDPTASPKAIDIDLKNAYGISHPQRGVYELDGDTLTVCETRDRRPKDLKATGEGVTLLVLERVRERK